MKNFFFPISFFTLILFISSKFCVAAENLPGVVNTTVKDARITGVITDGNNNQTISYASVAIYHASDSTLVTGVLSKDDGSFSIDKLPYGKYYIEVTFVGYKKHKVKNILLTSNTKSVALGSIKVVEASTTLKEVEVVGSVPPVTYQIDKKVVNVAQNINVSGSTLAEALQNVPSIQTDVEGNITLRGSSSYTVLIDGRPSPIGGSEALQQIPASLVQKVELITNPSAKYDAEGSAGIINIIMKKQRIQGSSGMFNVTAGTGNKLSSNMNLSYKVSKFSLTLGGDFSDNQSIFKSNGNVTDTLSNQILKKQVIKGSGNLHRLGKGIRAGIDYAIDDKNSLTLTGSIGDQNFIRSTTSDYHDTYNSILNPSQSDIYYTNHTHPGSEQQYKSVNLDFMRKISKKGEQLSAAVYLSGGPSNSVSTLQVDTTDFRWNRTAGSLIQQTAQNGIQNDLRSKVDYELPVGEKGKFGAGYQGRYLSSHGADHLTNFVGSAWVEDSSQLDKLNFKDQIQAAYVTYLNSLPLFGYQLGMRTEYENRVLTQEMQNKDYKLNRIDFLPTVHLYKQLPWQLQLQASYARRINRPGESNINPFVLHLDPQTIRQGNPGLHPEFANSLELNAVKQLNNSSFISVDGFLRKTTGLIQQVTLFDPTTQITTNTYENINHDRSMGTEFMLNLEPVKWFNLNSSFNIFNYHMFGTLVPGVATSTNTWNLHVNPTFHLTKTTTFQVTYIYNAPTIAAQGTRSGFYTSTISVRQRMLNRRASLMLQARNMFGHTIYDNTTESVHQFKYSSLEREAHVVMLTFSYRFNNYKVKENERKNEDDSNGPKEQESEDR